MTWNDVSVKKWIKLNALSGEDPNDLGVLTELISILYDMPFDDVRQLPINEAAIKRSEITELFSYELKDDELTQSFEAEGFTFQFADLQKDWIFAKNVDLSHFSSDINNFHITLTILYYPKDLPYETDTALRLSKIIAEQPISKLYAAWYFFFLFGMASVKITTNYSVLDMMTESTKFLMKAGQNPDRQLKMLKRLLLMKLKASGAHIEYSTLSQVAGLSNGTMS